MSDYTSPFRSIPSDYAQKGMDQEAVGANPAPRPPIQPPAPIWRAFVQNSEFEKANKSSIAAEHQQMRADESQQRRNVADGDVFRGGSGRLVHKAPGQKPISYDANEWVDHPIAGPEARKSLWDKEIRTARQEAETHTLNLQNPAFHARGKTDKEIETIQSEAFAFPTADPEHVKRQALIDDDAKYRVEKADMSQRAWDAKARASRIETMDPEAWWQERQSQPAPTPTEQRQATVQAAQTKQAEAKTADESSAADLKAINDKLMGGVTGEESKALQAQRAEILAARPKIAEAAIGAQKQVEGVQAEAQAKLEEQKGDTMRGLETSIRQIPQLGYGVAALVGDTAEKITGFGEDLKSWGLEKYKASSKGMEPLSKDTDSFSTSWGKATNEGDVGALVDFVQYGLGYFSGQALESLAVSAIGGVIGGASTGPAAPVGAATGVVGGLVAKGAVKSTAKGLIEKLIEKQALAMATKEAAKLTAKQGVEATAEAIAKRAATEQLRKQAAKDIGSTAALLMNGTLMELGSIYPEAVDQAAAEGREMTRADVARVWMSGIVAGGIEGVTDKIGIDLLKGKFSDALPGGRVAGALVGGVADAGVEGVTEGVQTGIERFGARQSLTDAQAQKQYIDAAALGAVGGGAMGGAGGFVGGGKKAPDTTTPPPSPEVALENVNTNLAAMGQATSPATADEMHRAAFIARETDGPAETADAILIQRELAAIAEEDAQILPAAQESLAQAQASGDKGAIKVAETALEQATTAPQRAHLVSATVKIAAGQQLNQLTSEELTAVGYESKPAKDGQIEFTPIKPAKGTATPAVAPMIRQGADGSIILTDAAVKAVGSVSTRAGGRIAMSETEAIAKANARAEAAQQVSTGSENGAEGELQTGLPASAGRVPIETNPPVEFDVPMRVGQPVRVQATTAQEAEREAASMFDAGTNSVLQGQATPVTPAVAVTQPPSTGVGGLSPSETGTPAEASPVAATSTAVTKARAIVAKAQTILAEHNAGRVKSLNDNILAVAKDTGMNVTNETTLKQVIDHLEAKYPTAKIEDVPAEAVNRVTSLVGKALGGYLKNPAVKAVLLIDPKGRAKAETRETHIVINPRLLIEDISINNLPDADAKTYIDRMIFEELHHLAQLQTFREIYENDKQAGPDYEVWRDQYCQGLIAEFQRVGIYKDALTVYGEDIHTREAYVQVAEINRMILQDAMTGNPTEATKAAFSSPAIREVVSAAIAKLKEFVKSFRANPTAFSKELVENIDRVEELLDQYDIPELTGTPVASTTDARNRPEKPNRSGKDTGNAQPTEAEGTSEPASSGGNQPGGLEAPVSPAWKGKTVEFVRNGERLRGIVAEARMTQKRGMFLSVKLDKPDAEGVPTRGVFTDEMKDTGGKPISGFKDLTLEAAPKTSDTKPVEKPASPATSERTSDINADTKESVEADQINPPAASVTKTPESQQVAPNVSPSATDTPATTEVSSAVQPNSDDTVQALIEKNKQFLTQATHDALALKQIKGLLKGVQVPTSSKVEETGEIVSYTVEASAEVKKMKSAKSGYEALLKCLGGGK